MIHNPLRNLQGMTLHDPDLDTCMPLDTRYSQLKNAPLGRRMLLNLFSALSHVVEPVTLLQMSGSYTWFAKSRSRYIFSCPLSLIMFV